MSKQLLFLTAAAEAATGVALLIVPSLVGRLLLGEELTGTAVTVAGVAGIALIGLAIACRPGRSRAGMATYGAGIALYLGFLGVTGAATGVLLWPAVALHGIATALLVWPSTNSYV